jgi:hypothetical protein
MATANKKIVETTTTSVITDVPEVKVVKKTVTKKATPKAAKSAVDVVEVAKVTKPAKVAAKKPAAKKSVNSVLPEQRYEMIATAAYYIAERRGFSGGYAMEDWIAAEAEIDTQLSV